MSAPVSNPVPPELPSRRNEREQDRHAGRRSGEQQNVQFDRSFGMFIITFYSISKEIIVTKPRIQSVFRAIK